MRAAEAACIAAGTSVDTLMEEVADFYDAEVEYDLKRLGSAIEPILNPRVARPAAGLG